MCSVSTAQWHSELHGRIAKLGIRKADLAHKLRLDASAFSAILNGRRTAAVGFEEELSMLLDIEERAQRAGKHAAERERKRAAKELGGAA